MLHLEYLETQKDVTKSIQFNILVICLITKNTKFPDFVFGSPDISPIPWIKIKRILKPTSPYRLVFTGGHNEKVGLYCKVSEAENKALKI